MRREAVLFLSHIYNDYTLMRFRQLQTSVIEGQDLIWVHTNFDGANFFREHNEIKHVHVHIRNAYIDKTNRDLPNNSYVFADTFNKLKKYDYYWFIEYDVAINSIESDPWRPIFEYYQNKDNYEYDADVIADHINTYITNHNYNIRYPFDHLRDSYKAIDKLNLSKNDIYFGFYTVCRFSYKFLCDISNENDWLSIYFEYGLTTFAYKRSMKVCTLLNTFSFGLNYNADYIEKKINSGTNAFLKKIYLPYYDKYPHGAILHSIKGYERH